MCKESAAALFLAALLLFLSVMIHSAAAESAAANAQPEQGVFLPVLMYHSVLKDPARTGEYVITPDSLEQDLAYLRKNGYTAVSGAEIFAYVHDGVPLPEKPVMLTFDDGHLNNLTYCSELMEKYNMKCTVNVVGAFTLRAEKENDPNPYYAYLTRQNISDMVQSGYFEIGCHTYNMHSANGRRGAEKNFGESAEEYVNALRKDIADWRSATEASSCVYAYPYGYYSEEGFEALRQEGFTVLLTCKEAENFIFTSGEGIVKLNRYNRSGLVQTDEFMKSIGI